MLPLIIGSLPEPNNIGGVESEWSKTDSQPQDSIYGVLIADHCYLDYSGNNPATGKNPTSLTL